MNATTPEEATAGAVTMESKALRFALATPADEADLRRLLGGTPTAGALRLGFAREPDYFAGEGLAGGDDVTIIARRDGRLACMGRCSMRTVFLNGEPRRVGYLGELRMAAGEPRALEVLREGYRFFHYNATRSRDAAEFFFTSIAADNQRARRVLEGGRRIGLPEYRFLTELVTFAAPVSGGAAKGGDDRDGDGRAGKAELSAYLERRARAGQLALSWDDARWASLARHGVVAEDFVVVRRAGELVAAGAVWDQRGFKQTVIHGYARALRWARPLINLASRCAGRPGLPRPGAALAQAATLGLTWDDESALTALWSRLRRRAAGLGVEWLTLSVDACDERCAQAGRVAGGREYRTRLYAVRWPDLPVRSLTPDGRPFRPEVGLL